MPHQVSQVAVLDQNKCQYGIESCGYHALKNALLVVLLNEKKISVNQFQEMINNTHLFNSVFDTTKQEINGGLDITLPRFAELIEQAKQGRLDVKHQILNRKVLQSLPIEEKIISVNWDSSGNAVPGHSGMQQDLYTAARLALFAKNKKPDYQVIALGIDNLHWITLAVNQNANGERSWIIMDSYRNQEIYQHSIDAFESILQYNPHELNQYLLNAYRFSSEIFFKDFEKFFDDELNYIPNATFSPYGQEEYNAKEYFIDNVNINQSYIRLLTDQFFLMKHHWLQDLKPKLHISNNNNFFASSSSTLSEIPNVSLDEKNNANYFVRQLYCFTDFLINNSNNISELIINIHQELKTALYEEDQDADCKYTCNIL